MKDKNMKFDLNSIPQNLIRVKEYDNGLKIVKYHNSVFFKNLWNEHPLLKECRGIILDAENNIVSHPFTKTYNVGENGTKLPDFPFIATDKINGFMGQMFLYDNKATVATTGTLDSDFVNLFKETLEKFGGFKEGWETSKSLLFALKDTTLLFEVCSPKDPHFINETPGVYLIGARDEDGGMHTEATLDAMAKILNAHLMTNILRPKWRKVEREEEWQELLDKDIEGYMLRSIGDQDILAKIKVKYYLYRKFLARCGKNKVSRIFYAPVEELFNSGLEEEFVIVVNKLRDKFTEAQWLEMDEQERLAVINQICGEVQ
jgi:hypothetical protein